MMMVIWSTLLMMIQVGFLRVVLRAMLQHENIIIHLTHLVKLVLHNVKPVPDMRLKIISTGLLDEDGYHNSSGNGLWKVTLGSLIVARVKRESKLYMTHPKISKSIVNAVDNDDMTELWNKRLGRMSEKGMSILSKKNMLSGVHDINLKNCYHCLAGKQTRLAFKSRSPSDKT
ncbi:retrovirus-related pol polyprotein from transposon TNT 1-94 [Tanacetum coccineum]